MKNIKHISELVINWHLTEACNYSCKYCYAAWVKPDSRREIIHDLNKVTKLLESLYEFFHPSNASNPLAQSLKWDSVRFNFAGGEPFLYSGKLSSAVKQARSLGYNVSMITNASYLNHSLLDTLAPDLSWLGISVDAQDAVINRAIGRLDKQGKFLNIDTLSRDLQIIRQQYPEFSLKLNTVVNRFNWEEDMNDLIRSFSPEKWKILRMLPVVNDNLAITNHQFKSFVDRHNTQQKIACVEDNSDMRDTYIMVDPYGRFFQNSLIKSSSGYKYSSSIIENGVGNAFAEINFSCDGFSERYSSDTKEV